LADGSEPKPTLVVFPFSSGLHELSVPEELVLVELLKDDWVLGELKVTEPVSNKFSLSLVPITIIHLGVS
jgi:hypothetical protein